MYTEFLLRKLIDHYEECINTLKSNVKVYSIANKYGVLVNMMNLLETNHVDWGICSCSDAVFNANVSKCEWVYKHFSQSLESGLVSPLHLYWNYWCKPPRKSESLDEAIEMLQTRVDIMKKILESGEIDGQMV